MRISGEFLNHQHYGSSLATTYNYTSAPKQDYSFTPNIHSLRVLKLDNLMLKYSTGVLLQNFLCTFDLKKMKQNITSSKLLFKKKCSCGLYRNSKEKKCFAFTNKRYVIKFSEFIFDTPNHTTYDVRQLELLELHILFYRFQFVIKCQLLGNTVY
jgi:hypothetical protein